MDCPRCHGLMIVEQCRDVLESSATFCVDGYRCLLCGEILDQAILDNRRRTCDPILPNKKKRRIRHVSLAVGRRMRGTGRAECTS